MYIWKSKGEKPAFCEFPLLYVDKESCHLVCTIQRRGHARLSAACAQSYSPWFFPLAMEGKTTFCLYIRVWRLREGRQDGQAHTGRRHAYLMQAGSPAKHVCTRYVFLHLIIIVCPCRCLRMHLWCLHAWVCTWTWKPVGNLGCHSSDINLCGAWVSYYPGSH